MVRGSAGDIRLYRAMQMVEICDRAEWRPSSNHTGHPRPNGTFWLLKYWSKAPIDVEGRQIE
jgi:hypothetical protein